MTTKQMHVSSVVSILKSDINVLIIKQIIITVKFSYSNIASEEKFKLCTYLNAFQRKSNDFYENFFFQQKGNSIHLRILNT
jgi:hypothetical protein